MTAPEVTPAVRRAAEALLAIEHGEHADMYEPQTASARASLAAGLVVEEIAKDLAGHVDFVVHDGRIECHDCGVDLGPDGLIPGWELQDRHVAQTIRTRIVGEAR